MRKVSIITMALMLALSVAAFSGNKGEQKTFKGTLSCTGCDLKKGSGAHSQCSIYGHKHALKTEDGKYVSFMENDHSEALIKGSDWHGAKVEVTGTYYADANMLDVTSFKIIDKSYGWCAGHKAMDMCHSGMGKMEGK